ncbi:MAG: hypothetical protein Q4D76_18085, partial [Oscillospiraceae bacterium]|nr:hypothetical protein [Oscillospiraceae bacterium]
MVPNAPAATTTFKVIADHIHDSLTYSASGDTLTATCESGDCYLASNKVSIKLSATSYVYSGKPATVCTDGTDPGATIKYNFYDWMYANAGDVIVKYVGRGNTRYSESSTPPTKIGTYTVKLYPASEESTPTNIASADFEIKRKSVPSGCNKVVDFGTRDWEYTIYKFGKYTSNVNGDAKGNFTDFRFYNITGSTVTYSVAGFASTSDAEYSGSLSSSTITTLLSGLKVTDGVGIKCAYSAATHVVTMTPITHSHTLDYTVSGGTITAKTTCHTNEHCEYRSKGEKTFTLTLEAKSLISYGSETYSATLSNKAEWTSAGIPVSTIQYFKATSEGGTEGTEEVTNLKGLPQGNYYAQVTVGSSANGTATVKVPFKIFPPHVCNGINFGNKFPSNGGSLSAGNYCLTEDVTLTKSLTIDGNVNLCLNGHVLKGNGIAGVIKVNSGKTLSIYDCGTATEHRGTLSDDGYLWTWDGGTDTGDTVIKGGIITGGAGQYGGVYSKGIIKMYGGSIAGNQTTSTYSGAGVYMDTDSKFTMYGGEIKYNKSTEDGGGIYVKTGCNLDIQGGRITNNYAADDGGGLYSGSDTSKAITICLTDGEISNNKAADDGGGIYLEASAPVRDGQFKMKGGSITDNIAGSDGGGICAAGSNWYMYKGTISGNTAADKGGGVYQGEGMMVKINIQHEGVINITGNTGSSGTKVQNLYLTHNDFISSDFNESSRIGLTLEDPYGSFSEMTEVQDWDIMFSSDEPYKYQIKNKSSGGIEADTGVTSKSHKWEYSENGNVLSAKCKGTANGCTMPSCGHDTDETAVKLTLTATDSVYSGNNVTANYGKGEAAVWKTVVGTDAPTISYQYRATEGGTYSATAETKDVGYYIASATVDTNKTATAEFKITKATQAAPAANVGYTIDYEAETITANEGYEVSTSNTELAAPVEGKAIPGDKYYIRKQGDDNNAPSSWTTITAPLRPEGPAGINYVTPTTAEGTDGAITGVSSLMEYRRSTSDEWTAIVSTEITYLSVGTYVVRYKATETAFASEV